MRKMLGLSKEEVNTGRQMNVDLAKCIALVLMVWIHMFEFLYEGAEGPIYTFIYCFCDHILCAPIFMACMGVGIIFSRDNSPKKLLKRGIGLFILGLALNVVRTLIEVDLYALITGETFELIGNIWAIEGDILGFAGMAFLLTALFKKLKLNETAIAAAALILSIAAQFLVGVQTGYYIVDNIIGYVWPTFAESYFPLFSWYIYVAAGMFFGYLLKHAENKRRFYNCMIICGLIGLAFLLLYNGCFTSEPWVYFFDETYYTWVSPVNSLPTCLFFFGWCGVCHYILPKKAEPMVQKVSSDTNIIFISHWIILEVVVLFMYLEIIPFIESDFLIIAIGAVIFILAVLMARFYKRKMSEGVDRIIKKHRAVIYALVCVITLGMAFSSVYIHNKNCPDSPYPNFLNGYEIVYDAEDAEE